MKKINKKDKKAKQIAFKIMRTKLDIKINRMTPLYFGKEKRKKKKRRKKFIKAQPLRQCVNVQHYMEDHDGLRHLLGAT